MCFDLCYYSNEPLPHAELTNNDLKGRRIRILAFGPFPDVLVLADLRSG